MAGMKCLKSFVVVVCVLMFLTGAVVFAAGVYFRVESGIMGSEAVTLLNNIRRNKISVGKMMLTHAYSMIALGATIMTKSVLGMRAAVKKSKCVLWIFISMIVFVILAQAVHVGLWVNTRTMTDEWLEGEMLNLLKEYQGPDKTDTISDGWNKLFTKAHCCGVVNATGDFEDIDSEWFNTNKQPSEVIPATCCMGVDDADEISSKIASSCTTTPEYFYSKGCQTKLIQLINVYSLIHICSAGGLLIFQMMSIFGSCTLLKRSNNRIFPRSTKNLPPPYTTGDRVMKTKF